MTPKDQVKAPRLRHRAFERIFSRAEEGRLAGPTLGRPLYAIARFNWKLGVSMSEMNTRRLPALIMAMTVALFHAISHDQAATRDEASRTEAAGYFSKPFDGRNLIAAITRAVTMKHDNRSMKHGKLDINIPSNLTALNPHQSKL
jgi:DNA-binding NarL/FixJ family response regulator